MKCEVILLDFKIWGSKYTHCQLNFWSTLSYEVIIRPQGSFDKTGKCTCHVTLGFVRVIKYLLWKSSKCLIFWACACSLNYPTCQAYTPYYIFICGLSGCTHFSTFSHKRYEFREKNLLNIKCGFCKWGWVGPSKHNCRRIVFISLLRIPDHPKLTVCMFYL
jgi:hypothetical protein